MVTQVRVCSLPVSLAVTETLLSIWRATLLRPPAKQSICEVCIAPYLKWNGRLTLPAETATAGKWQGPGTCSRWPGRTRCGDETGRWVGVFEPQCQTPLWCISFGTRPSCGQSILVASRPTRSRATSWRRSTPLWSSSSPLWLWLAVAMAIFSIF